MWVNVKAHISPLPNFQRGWSKKNYKFSIFSFFFQALAPDSGNSIWRNYLREEEDGTSFPSFCGLLLYELALLLERSSWTSKKRKAAVQFSRKFDGVPPNSNSFLGCRNWRGVEAITRTLLSSSYYEDLEAPWGCYCRLLSTHFEEHTHRLFFTYKIQCNSIPMLFLEKKERVLPIKRLIRAKLVNEFSRHLHTSHSVWKFAKKVYLIFFSMYRKIVYEFKITNKLEETRIIIFLWLKPTNEVKMLNW